MTLTFPHTNDSHRNARNYRIDSQTPENTSHFAMRITLFSSLTHTPVINNAVVVRSLCRSRRGRRKVTAKYRRDRIWRRTLIETQVQRVTELATTVGSVDAICCDVPANSSVQ